MADFTTRCRVAVVIPARLASTRLPRKLLLRDTGKPLVVHTLEAASAAKRPEMVCVATADREIAQAVRDCGGTVCLTDPRAASGTDRVAEVARRLAWADVIVNVQGDEPEISPAAIDLAVDRLERCPAAELATLATPIRSREQLEDPACVKVVLDSAGRALYFSRSPIPHPRDWDDALLSSDPPAFLQHIGLYAYRRGALLELAAMPRCSLEKVENLEQLRALSAGRAIEVGIVAAAARGVDTPADYREFVSRWRAGRRAA